MEVPRLLIARSRGYADAIVGDQDIRFVRSVCRSLQLRGAQKNFGGRLEIRAARCNGSVELFRRLQCLIESSTAGVMSTRGERE